jgi:hypothetical protein
MGETDQLEMTYTDELFEIAAGYEFNDRLRIHHKDRRTEQLPALSLNLALAASESARIGTSWRRVHGGSELQASGIYASFAMGEYLYLLAEADRVFEGSSPAMRKAKTVSYSKLGFEYLRGMINYLQFESEKVSNSTGHSMNRNMGLGVQLFPRPHFEIDLFGGQLRSEQYDEPVNIVHLLVHHYL